MTPVWYFTFFVRKVLEVVEVVRQSDARVWIGSVHADGSLLF